MVDKLLALNLLMGPSLIAGFITWFVTVSFVDAYFVNTTDWVRLFSDPRRGAADNIFRRIEAVYGFQLFVFFLLPLLLGWVATDELAAMEGEKGLAGLLLTGLVVWLQLGFSFFVYDLNLSAPYRKTPGEFVRTLGKTAPTVRPYREVALQWLPFYLLTGLWLPLLVLPNL